MIYFLFQPKRNGSKSRLWSARVRLDGWAKPKTISLHVTDKRVAEQKLRDVVARWEREAVGLALPEQVTTAAATPIADLMQTFLADLIAKGRSSNTIKAYRRCIGKLCVRCGWKLLRDVTGMSFIKWRSLGEVGPKFANDLLGYMRAYLRWLVRRKLIPADPLAEVDKAHVKQGRGYRRALSIEEINRLLATAPFRRSVVYQFAMSTGLRRAEMNRLTWGDFDLDAVQPLVRVPGSISKNRVSATIGLRPELVIRLREYRPDMSLPSEWAFRGRVPNMGTVRRDFQRAGISLVDDFGRKVDFHALRHTFGTLLQISGVSPRAAMELMRHSDLKLTMRIYTDAAHLPLVAEMAKLPVLGS